MDAQTKEKPTLDMAYRVKQLRTVREHIKNMDEEHDKKMEKWHTAKARLEGALMQWLLDHKIKTFNTAEGNITQVDNTTFPIEDQVAFSSFVIENRAWEMLDWKANKTAVNKFIEEYKGELPPGLKPNPHPHLRVSGPGQKRTQVKKGFDVNTPEEE